MQPKELARVPSPGTVTWRRAVDEGPDPDD
jgi:hypothetical protein